MARKPKVFNGLCSRRVPGVEHHRAQVDVRVAATGIAGVHRALVGAGVHGWSLYSLRNYWSEGGDIPEAIENPGVVFYRPLDARDAPWVPWDQEYPLDAIPAHIRED